MSRIPFASPMKPKVNLINNVPNFSNYLDRHQDRAMVMVQASPLLFLQSLWCW